MSYRKLLPLFCAVVVSVSVSAFAKPTPPATTIKPKLKVNVLAGVSVTDEEIKAMVKKANETLKKAGISYDLDPNISRGVSDSGNDDGKLTQAELRRLDRAGQKEADRLYGKGKGVKVYISNEILGDPNTMGYAGHVKKNRRGRLIGRRVIHIKKDSDPNYVPDMGPTLAHESGHLFTLGDRGPVDVNNNKYSDSNGHTTEPNNFMNEIIDPNNNKVTPDQAKEMKEGAKRMCACVKNIQLPDSLGGPVVTGTQQIIGGWVDDICDVADEAYYDLSTGSFYAENEAATLEIGIITEGILPPNNVTAIYTVYLDTDNDDMTGVGFGPIAGADYIIEASYCSEDSPADICAYFQNYTGTGSEFETLPFASVEGFKGLIDKRNNPPEAISLYDGVYIEVPMYLLQANPLGEVVECAIESSTLDFGTTPPTPIIKDDIVFMWETSDIVKPSISLLSARLEPYEPIEISGSNFTPAQEVTITLDNEPIGTTMTDGAGSFFDVFYFEPGSDPFDGGVCKSPWHFVTAQDLEAKSDYSIMQLVPNEADINADTKVNFLDLAIMAQNWLAGSNGLVVP